MLERVHRKRGSEKERECERELNYREQNESKRSGDGKNPWGSEVRLAIEERTEWSSDNGLLVGLCSFNE